MTDWIKINVRPATHAKARRLAAHYGLTIYEVIEQALDALALMVERLPEDDWARIKANLDHIGQVADGTAVDE